jgi:hypothetical protein
MQESDATVMALTFAKTIAKIAEFAVDLAETLHKDLGIEYSGPYNSKSTKSTQKKRSRTERDPNEPKRPLTAYMIYSAAVREDAKKRGDAQLQMKDIADMWAKLDEQEKERYISEANQQKEVYEQLVAEYRARKSLSQKSESEISGSEGEDVAPPSKVHHP